jgi:hypothetical protein
LEGGRLSGDSDGINLLSEDLRTPHAGDVRFDLSFELSAFQEELEVITKENVYSIKSWILFG